MPNDPNSRPEAAERRYTVKQCDKRWFTLTPVAGDDSVRYCDHCNKSVHWCKDEAQLADAAAQGLCVAGENKTAFIDVLRVESDDTSEARRAITNSEPYPGFVGEIGFETYKPRSD
ncbi:hypothetical protein LJ739_18795 [Aestuariibacter halophilus]|uniref:Uncharacterized protein n=1 Tax=Fluctibacter halophilus TaxID=226011 RepID=A0ABS8GCQ9_9ALTE|nr:hypothetical protein [Aestuariibacter halophilus]MCC2618312.1 hypothetical protein [Aestuariibacter halophilus]